MTDGPEYECKELVLYKISSGEYKTRDYSGKSDIWNNFFEVLNEHSEYINYVICKGCKSLYCFQLNKTGTSSLSRHITKCPALLNEKRQAASLKFISKSKTITVEDNKSFINTCIALCTKDCKPFSVFEGNGMIEFSQALINIGAKYGNLHAKTILPTRATISKHSRELAEEEIKKKMKEIVDCLNDDINVAISTDTWLDKYRKKHYFTVSCHYISQDWKLNHVSLGCQEFLHEDRTDENFVDELASYLENIGFSMADLMTKCVFVTDLRSDIKHAFSPDKWSPCISQILNVVLYHAFSSKFIKGILVQDLSNYIEEECEFPVEMEELLTNSKSLVTHLKRNGCISEMPSLRQETEMTWSADLLLLMNIVKEEEKIKEILHERGEISRLNNINLNMLHHLNDFLEPFKVVSDTLGGDKYCTFHAIVLLKIKLEKHLKIKYSDPPLIQTLKQKAYLLINEKYTIQPVHWVASFLCPKFKGLTFLSHSEREDTYNLVRRLLADIAVTDSENAVDANVSKGKCKEGIEHSYTSKVSKKRKVNVNVEEYVDEEDHENEEERDEIQMYLNLNTSLVYKEFEKNKDLIAGINVLRFWENNVLLFPKLSKLARSILCIPATSAPCKKLFQSVASLNRERRTRLNPESLNSRELQAVFSFEKEPQGRLKKVVRRKKRRAQAQRLFPLSEECAEQVITTIQEGINESPAEIVVSAPLSDTVTETEQETTPPVEKVRVIIREEELEDTHDEKSVLKKDKKRRIVTRVRSGDSIEVTAKIDEANKVETIITDPDFVYDYESLFSEETH